MQKLVIGAAVVLTLAAAGAAVAGESVDLFPRASGGVSGETIRTHLEGMGYRVDRIKPERDCWEVRAVNDSGFAIKAEYDRASGELIQAKLR